MSGRRSSTIIRIMDIESQKKNLIHNVHFKRLKENDMLFSNSYNGRVFKLYDPFNLDNLIEVRYDSDDIEKYKEQNAFLLEQFEKRLDRLSQEKMRLQNKIF